jgi:hypothetical protein
MGLSVIGAGYGRTGTLSLKRALEMLGYVKCHHMIEVINKPGEPEKWLDAIDNPNVDWDDLFAGFQACVDWPACHFYKALADYYPDAKVILTIRDPLDWFQSMSATTLGVIRPRLADPGSRNLGTELVVKGAFEGNIDDAEHGVAIFERHTREVIANIAPERLLVYDVREGWGPLCAFLGKPVPAEPFPRVNSRDEFHDIFFGSGRVAS